MSGRPNERAGRGSSSAAGDRGTGGKDTGTARPGWRRDAFLQAGFLVGAAVGAAATVFGRRLERSARQGLIDWRTVERLAVDRARNSPGSLTPDELRRVKPVYASAMREIVPALEAELGSELPGVVERASVVSRETWVRTNVSAFRALMSHVEGELLDELVPEGSGIVKASIAIANRAVANRQLGYLLGFVGRRVLGQYDLAILSAESNPGALLFLEENIRLAAGNLGLPLNPFRTWIALHETTHAFEFEAHPWLRPYLAQRMERQLVALSRGTTANRDLGSMIGRAIRASGDEPWMLGLMSEEQRREFMEMQAVMSLLEGFGDYVMDQVGRDLVFDVETISKRFHARREQRTGMERAIMRAAGLDMKMEQYKQGEAFVAEIAKARGKEALREVWRGPETLPRPEEIERPSLWLSRVFSDDVSPGSGAAEGQSDPSKPATRQPD